MTNYSPMATPWRPAWLPAGDVITELLHTEPGKVAVRCMGTYNGKLPAGSIYYAVTWANGTLNPDMYTQHVALTGLTQAGWDNRYQKGLSTLWLDLTGTSGYMMRFTGLTLTGPSTLEVLQLTLLSAATLTPATEVLGFTGTDALGVLQSTANQPPMLASLGASKIGETAYRQYTDIINGMGVYQTAPVLTILSRPGNAVTFAMSHETWAGIANGGSDRKLVTRVFTLNPVAKTCNVDANYRGPVQVDAPGNVTTITAPCASVVDIGNPSLGNYDTGWSRCIRTGEVLTQSTRYSIGACNMRYIHDATLADWLDPRNRKWAASRRGRTSRTTRPRLGRLWASQRPSAPVCACSRR
jgi:hypothetical protein